MVIFLGTTKCELCGRTIEHNWDSCSVPGPSLAVHRVCFYHSPMHTEYVERWLAGSRSRASKRDTISPSVVVDEDDLLVVRVAVVGTLLLHFGDIALLGPVPSVESALQFAASFRAAMAGHPYDESAAADEPLIRRSQDGVSVWSPVLDEKKLGPRDEAMQAMYGPIVEGRLLMARIPFQPPAP